MQDELNWDDSRLGLIECELTYGVVYEKGKFIGV